MVKQEIYKINDFSLREEHGCLLKKKKKFGRHKLGHRGNFLYKMINIFSQICKKRFPFAVFFFNLHEYVHLFYKLELLVYPSIAKIVSLLV